MFESAGYLLIKELRIFSYLKTNQKFVLKLSSKAENVLGQIKTKTNLGDLRKIAKNIKTDHDLAMELWSTGKLFPRLLAILIMDNKRISQDLINKLDKDMHTHPFDDRNKLMDWFMANQLVLPGAFKVHPQKN